MAHAEPNRPVVRYVSPPTLAAPPSAGYSHVAESSGGRTIYVAGQVALDAQGQLVGPGDVGVQAEQVFANLAAALASVGSDFRSVVRLTYFLVDLSQFPKVRAVRDRYVDRDHPPTSSAIEVRRLVREEYLVEIDAIAAAPV